MFKPENVLSVTELYNLNKRIWIKLPESRFEYKELVRIRDYLYTIHKFEPDRELIVKLYHGVEIYSEKGCWINKETDWSSYRRISVNNKQTSAHRISYELFNNKPLIHQGCHKCDRKGCVNPFHIFDGTQSDNINDARWKDKNIDVDVAKDKQLRKEMIELRRRDRWKKLDRFCR